jgi:hypothetical protein
MASLQDRHGIRLFLDHRVLEGVNEALQQRQRFWTEVMEDPKLDTQTRLKASELLGRAECDFVERKIVEGPNGGPVLVGVAVAVKEMDLEERAALLVKSAAPLIPEFLQ